MDGWSSVFPNLGRALFRGPAGRGAGLKAPIGSTGRRASFAPSLQSESRLSHPLQDQQMVLPA